MCTVWAEPEWTAVLVSGTWAEPEQQKADLVSNTWAEPEHVERPRTFCVSQADRGAPNHPCSLQHFCLASAARHCMSRATGNVDRAHASRTCISRLLWLPIAAGLLQLETGLIRMRLTHSACMWKKRPQSCTHASPVHTFRICDMHCTATCCTSF